jgi:hypothetical protein
MTAAATVVVLVVPRRGDSAGRLEEADHPEVAVPNAKADAHPEEAEAGRAVLIAENRAGNFANRCRCRMFS